MVFGAVIAAVGGTGLFAALSDTASTGVNRVDSAALAASADLKLALSGAPVIDADPNTPFFPCGTYSDDLASPLVTATDSLPGDAIGSAGGLCLKNEGSRNLALTLAATTVGQVEVACTGDEALVDTTCGAPGAGELGQVIELSVSRHDCQTGAQIPVGGVPSVIRTVAQWSAVEVSFGQIGAGESACFAPSVRHLPDASTVPNQAAQSDRVTWQYRFTGTAI
jgi:hypothetical protein